MEIIYTLVKVNLQWSKYWHGLVHSLHARCMERKQTYHIYSIVSYLWLNL